MSTVRFMALAFCALLFTNLAQRATSEPKRAWAGIVLSYAGEAKGYQIERGRQRLPVQYYAPVLPGDRIHVISIAGSLTVSMTSGQTAAITRNNSPFYIDAPRSQVPTVLDNWIAVVGDRLSRSQDRSVELSTRGENSNVISLMPSGFSDTTQVIFAGEKTFALRWSGGEPSFAIRVQSESGRDLINEVDVTNFELAMTSRRTSFTPGRYKITVRAHNGATTTRWIEARPESELRVEWPPVFAGFEPVTQQILRFSWLANAQNGTLRYEAYLQLRNLLRANPGRIEIERAIAALEQLDQTSR